LIERVFRERWGRVLASVVGYVGDFDLAEESTQEAFAIALRLPGTTGRSSRVALVPIGASNARSGTDVGINMPTHRVPAEDELR